MKKKKLFKVLLPSLLAIFLAGGVVVGATYALFTSSSKADISVTAGKVSVKASMSGIELYSASLTDDDDTGVVLEGSHELGQFSADYYHVKQTNGKFNNGGTGSLSAGGDMTLTNMTAGDMAKATLDITNSSNVAIKYRLVAECIADSEDALRLFAELEFSALGEDLTGVRKFVTNWSYLEAGASIDSSDVSVYLPLVSTLQDKSTLIRFSVEAVQGNAYTVDEAAKYYIEFDDQEVEKGTGDALKDMMFYYDGASTNEVVVSLPASQGTMKAFIEDTGEPIVVGDTLTCRVTELQDGEPGTISVGAQEVAKNYEISMYDQNNKKIKSTAENIKVYVFVGEELDIIEVVHDGVVVPEGVQASGEYYEYNSDSGYITVTTNKFSPFSVKWEAPVVFEGDGTKANPYKVHDARELMAIDTKGFDAGTMVYYQLLADIDLDDVDISQISSYIHVSNLEAGVDLDLNGHKIENIKTHFFYMLNFGNMHDGEFVFAANRSASLIYYIYEGYNIKSANTFKNLTLSGYQNVNSHHYGPVICYAYSRNTAALELEVTIDSVINNLTIINTNGGNGDTGGFLGYVQGPYVTKIDIKNSQFNGKIQSRYASGFINECCRASAYTGYKEQNMARITSTNNSLSGQLIASVSATAFGGRQAAADGDITKDAEWNAAWNGSVELKPGYIITTMAPVSDMIVNAGSMAKGDAIKINHTRSTVVKYQVTYNYWYSKDSVSFGGFPDCIVQTINVTELGEITTQFYNALIADADAAGASRVWYDSTAKEYKFFAEGQKLLTDWAAPSIIVQAFDANGALVAHQQYDITFAD